MFLVKTFIYDNELTLQAQRRTKIFFTYRNKKFMERDRQVNISYYYEIQKNILITSFTSNANSNHCILIRKFNKNL